MDTARRTGSDDRAKSTDKAEVSLGTSTPCNESHWSQLLEFLTRRTKAQQGPLPCTGSPQDRGAAVVKNVPG